ncbi:MAG: GTP 3',8-cyclase MoaA, partial [Sulfobacillus sp.]
MNNASVPVVQDTRRRGLEDLRISVTDRCNFRCVYCMPKEVFGSSFHFLPRQELLTFDEITRLARLFVALGVRKIRLTGGEPLVRRDLDVLVSQIAAIPELEDLAMTTNGSMLTVERAKALKDAGLKRITISLDALDDELFRSMNDVNFPVSRVLNAIDAARRAKLDPVKVNMVVKRGLNQDAILPMADRFRGQDVVVRFIEFMDVGTTNGWRLEDVVPGAA